MDLIALIKAERDKVARQQPRALAAERQYRPVERASCSPAGRTFRILGRTFARWSSSCDLQLDPQCQYVDDRELLKNLYSTNDE